MSREPGRYSRRQPLISGKRAGASFYVFGPVLPAASPDGGGRMRFRILSLRAPGKLVRDAVQGAAWLLRQASALVSGRETLRPAALHA